MTRCEILLIGLLGWLSAVGCIEWSAVLAACQSGLVAGLALLAFCVFLNTRSRGDVFNCFTLF
jgi:hypothetical protein